MKNQNRLYRVLFIVTVIIFFALEISFSSARNKPLTAATDIINAPVDYIVEEYAISASDILDSEKRFNDGRELVVLCDSLWEFISMTTVDSLDIAREDSIETEKKLREGMRRIGGNLQIDPKLRKISPRARKLLNDDIIFIISELLKQAASRYFDAKKINPYNMDLDVSFFIQFYAKYKQYTSAYPQPKFQELLLKQVQETKWLPYEIHDVFILTGNIHFDLARWQKAFKNYEKAYRMVDKVLYPIGIDSAYASYKDSIACKTFIAEERKLMARARLEESKQVLVLSNSLWDFYKWVTDSSEFMNISFYDSIAARKKVDKALQRISSDRKEVRKRLNKIQKRKYKLRKDDLLFLIKQLMLTAESGFLTAKQLDPFDFLIRMNLIDSIYVKLGERFQSSVYYEKAVEEMEHLLWAKRDRSGYFSHLGMFYRELHKWDKAYENFKQAEIVLRKMTLMSGRPDEPEKYFDNPESVPVDTVTLFLYTLYQAESQRKAYKGKESLALYRKACSMAPTAEYTEDVEYWIDWINWDNGNIRASEVSDSAEAFYDEQNFKSAKDVYIKLLGMLWTKRTTDEINWRIARIDFDELGNKAKGIMRMQQVYESLPTDSASIAEIPFYNHYLTKYGRMCYELGMQYLEEEDKLYAYVYFTQAAVVQWWGKSKSNYQLAYLSEFDPREAIRLCEIALSERHQLKPPDMRKIARLLADSYQKEAKFKIARDWYKKSLDRDWLEKRKM